MVSGVEHRFLPFAEGPSAIFLFSLVAMLNLLMKFEMIFVCRPNLFHSEFLSSQIQCLVGKMICYEINVIFLDLPTCRHADLPTCRHSGFADYSVF